MKAVIQRAREASVTVQGDVIGKINIGMIVYFSVEANDTLDMIAPFLDKLVKLRIFEDENKKMNLGIDKLGSEILFISQFTIASNLDRGNRPDFATCKAAHEAEEFYQEAIRILKEWGYKVECGKFGAEMIVKYINDGPATFVLDSDKLARFRKKKNYEIC